MGFWRTGYLIWIIAFSVVLAVHEAGFSGAGGFGGAGYPLQNCEDAVSFYRRSGYQLLGGESGSARLGPGKYVLSGEFVVPSGQDVRFLPGAIIYCEAESIIRVRGQLVVIGDSSSPVFFTPLPVSEYCGGAGFDDTLWHGILVEDSAVLYMESAIVSGYASGIDIRSHDAVVRLRNTVLSGKSRFSLMVDGKKTGIDEGKPVTWLWPEAGYAAPSAGRGRKIRPAIPIRIGLAAVAAGGIGMAVLSEKSVRKYLGEYYYYSENQEPFRADESYREAGKAAALRRAGVIVGVAGAIGFTVTFFF